MAAKLYKAAEVCDMTQLQQYVLRSWEKEFPGIGVAKSDDAPRMYRQSDIDQVLRIKQLVFGEGLTLAGARRRLDGGSTAAPAKPAAPAAHAAPLFDALDGGARERIATIRDGLQSLLAMLSQQPARGAHPQRSA